MSHSGRLLLGHMHGRQVRLAGEMIAMRVVAISARKTGPPTASFGNGSRGCRRLHDFPQKLGT